MGRNVICRISLFVLAPALVLSACGSDDANGVVAADAAIDAVPIDAPIDAAPDAPNPAVLDCLGDPSPTTAPDPVTVTAGVITIDQTGASPVADVPVTVHLGSDPDGAAVAMGTSDAGGQVILEIESGGVAQAVFLKATPEDTYLPTEVYPPDVVSADAQVPAPLFTIETINLLSGLTGQDANLEEDGLAVVLVLDCLGNPITNAIVTPPSGTVVYAGDNGIPNSGLTATTSAGLAFVFNVEPGVDLVLDAEVDGKSLRDVSFRAVAGTILSAGIQP